MTESTMATAKDSGQMMQYKGDTSSQMKVAQLQTLLTRAQIYSKFLADRLQDQINELKSNTNDTDPKGRKRKGQSQAKSSPVGFVQPRALVGGVLRDYQVEGVQWLVSLYENGLNGILADEMGLGKTIQCIAFLAFLKERGIEGPFLIIAPLSTLSNWVNEFNKFTPSIPSLMYHGSVEERKSIRSKYLQNHSSTNSNSSRKSSATFSVLITSYEISMNDKRYLSNIPWKYMIIDEGHRLKNFNCRLLKDLREYKSENRLLLTGTPLQNNLTELWSLLNFLLPEIFNDVDDFLNWFDIDLDETTSTTTTEGNVLSDFGNNERVEMLNKLHLILKPLLLRRLKVDVESELPLKREYIIAAPLTEIQRKYYHLVLQGKANEIFKSPIEVDQCDEVITGKRKSKKVYRSSTSKIFSDDHEDEEVFIEEILPDIPTKKTPSSTSLLGLKNRMMQARKVCNHPYLFLHPTDPSRPEGLRIDEELISCSGKMIILDQLLDALLKRKHKVLIFSQMTRMLDILSNYFEWKGLGYYRIDGSTPQDDRQRQVSLFQKTNKVNIFLLSTRAGGLGINLVAADTVIFYDSDWNPQMDLQAQDRAHRIGQTKPVLVLRLSTMATVEGVMLERAETKRKLERLVIHNKKFKGRQQLLQDNDSLNAKDLEAILLGRDYERLKSGGTCPSKLSLTDLEMLLDRSRENFERNEWKGSEMIHVAPTTTSTTLQ